MTAGARPAAGDATAGDVGDRLGEFPLAGLVESNRGKTPSFASSFEPTGLTRRDYLDLANGVVRHFAGFQNRRGAILDPYEGTEKQYATPAFACAAAILHASGHDRHLLPQCLDAMDAATVSLAAGEAADGHADFYTVLLMHAFRALEGHAPPKAIARWRKRLRSLDPRNVYAFQPSAETVHNWNLVAAGGEWMRHRAGLGGDVEWIAASLARQIERLTPHGMYRDPGDPLAYDSFARAQAVNLLEQGYAGPYAAVLEEGMARGAWTSLFLQSPKGQLPCGGRSAHHQWNEATHAMICEVYAGRASRLGDEAAAGIFRRSARLALQSISGWVRPSGDLWIVKNRSDPSLRHGYESYSFHSQYNLLTAATLAMAYLYAEEEIRELPCPAETGGFVVPLGPAFHKVFANAGGMYLEIETRADAQYNPTGLLRVHHPRIAVEASVSDGVSRDCVYDTPKRPTLSLSLCPGWRGPDGTWHNLAEHSNDVLQDAPVRTIAVSPERMEFSVAYRGAMRGNVPEVRQQFTATPGRIEVTDVVEGAARSRQYFPLPLTDGKDPTQVEVSGRRASVRHSDGSGLVFEALGEGPDLVRLGVSEPSRNGMLDAAFAESASPMMRYSVQPLFADG